MGFGLLLFGGFSITHKVQWAIIFLTKLLQNYASKSNHQTAAPWFSWRLENGMSLKLPDTDAYKEAQSGTLSHNDPTISPNYFIGKILSF